MWRIFILRDRWNIVGNVIDDRDDGTAILANAKVIRYWGTTKGIGELGKGPTDKTICDPIHGQTTVYGHDVIFSFDATGWS